MTSAVSFSTKFSKTKQYEEKIPEIFFQEMFVSVLHSQNEIIYLNGNCRAKTIKEYLRQRCPLIISKVIDLIDTVGKLLHLSWISDITNARKLFRDQTLYILVVLTTNPVLKVSVIDVGGLFGRCLCLFSLVFSGRASLVKSFRKGF